MAVPASSIIQKAQIALQDEEGVRWPASELVLYLNAGQRELVRLRPDQTAVKAPVVLASGYWHTLPPQAQALIDITCNLVGSKRRITRVSLAQLDAVYPNWRDAAPSQEITHFSYDLRSPFVFHTYPPAQNAQVEMVYSTAPVDVPPTAGSMYLSVTGNIGVPDVWEDALLNFVLYKAYAKDAEFGGNAQLSAAYYSAFSAAVGSQLQSAATVAST